MDKSHHTKNNKKNTNTCLYVYVNFYIVILHIFLHLYIKYLNFYIAGNYTFIASVSAVSERVL